MTEMVTVGGIRYRAEDAKRLKLTPDTKAFAKKIADNEVEIGTSEAAYKASQAVAAKGGRKAAGTAETPATGVVGSGTPAGTDAGAGGDAGTSGDAGTGTGK